MVFNPDKEIIPFYPNKNWHYNDKQCKDNAKFVQKLIRNQTYHFSAVIPGDWNEIKLELYNIVDVHQRFITDYAVYYDHEDGLSIIAFDFIADRVPEGLYYFTIQDEKFPEDVLYSEPFCIKEFTPQLTLRWSNNCIRVGNVIYPKDENEEMRFRRLHLENITVVLSETQTTDEVVQDSTGNETSISQTVVQKYMFSAALPFYVVEALVTLPLHSEVYIEEFNRYSKRAKRIEILNEPDEFGCMSKLTFRFETNRVFKAGCCNDSMNLKLEYNPEDYDPGEYETT